MGQVPTLGEMQSPATADGVNQATARRLPCEIRVVVGDVLHNDVGLWTDGGLSAVGGHGARGQGGSGGGG